MFRMSSALDARNRAQLAGLFTDLPPRPPTLLARLQAAFLRRDVDSGGGAGNRHPGPHAASGRPGAPAGSGGRGCRRRRRRWSSRRARGAMFTIGRRSDCDLRIADLSVSRLHAQLDRGEDGWLLSDLGSRNGTRVNGWLLRDRSRSGPATFCSSARPPSSSRPQGPGRPDAS